TWRIELKRIIFTKNNQAMKKVMFAVALLVFTGSIATTAYAASTGATKEITKVDKKKKKKKKGSCCSAQSGTTQTGGSCCTKKQ
ncbi:MAG: hypothetical protein ACK49D_09605, partial [Flavobacteriia bacterium]